MNCSRSVTIAAHSHEESRWLQGPATEYVIWALWQYSCYKTARFSFVTKFSQKLYNWPFFLSFVVRPLSTYSSCGGYCCIWYHPITHHSLTHTHTVGRTPLGEGSARRRNLNLTHDTTRTIDINPCPRHDSNPHPSKGVAAHPRLRSRGHRDRLHNWPTVRKYCLKSMVQKSRKQIVVDFKQKSLEWTS